MSGRTPSRGLRLSSNHMYSSPASQDTQRPSDFAQAHTVYIDSAGREVAEVTEAQEGGGWSFTNVHLPGSRSSVSRAPPEGVFVQSRHSGLLRVERRLSAGSVTSEVTEEIPRSNAFYDTFADHEVARSPSSSSPHISGSEYTERPLYSPSAESPPLYSRHPLAAPSPPPYSQYAPSSAYSPSSPGDRSGHRGRSPPSRPSHGAFGHQSNYVSELYNEPPRAASSNSRVPNRQSTRTDDLYADGPRRSRYRAPSVHTTSSRTTGSSSRHRDSDAVIYAETSRHGDHRSYVRIPNQGPDTPRRSTRSSTTLRDARSSTSSFESRTTQRSVDSFESRTTLPASRRPLHSRDAASPPPITIHSMRHVQGVTTSSGSTMSHRFTFGSRLHENSGSYWVKRSLSSSAKPERRPDRGGHWIRR
ncbi:MAG: hypothetical protein M1833_000803 [Piccolia ochrophora]|nr:MAG: hypothetical protein M1833_000803 [Piccolia ochrophora]